MSEGSGQNQQPVARLSGVSLRYGDALALDGIDLEIPSGRMVAVIGPDGVGKSSLLSLIAGARKVQQGRVEAMGGDMAWLGPSLTTAGPELGLFGTSLTQIVESGSILTHKQPVSNYFTGDGLNPFLGRLTDFLDKIGPEVSPLAPMLQPVVTDAVSRAPQLDIGALIGQALHGVDPDGTLHFRINVK